MLIKIFSLKKRKYFIQSIKEMEIRNLAGTVMDKPMMLAHE